MVEDRKSGRGWKRKRRVAYFTGAVLVRGRQGKHVRLGKTREGRRGGNVRTLYTLALPPVEGSRAFTWQGCRGKGQHAR